MAKIRLQTYKEAAAYVDKMGLGRETHRPVIRNGSDVTPQMRVNSEGQSVPIMFWRMSNHRVEVMKEALEVFRYSGYHIGLPPDEGVAGTLVGRMPGKDGAFYIDVEFEHQEVGPGLKPLITLVRGACDKVPEKAGV